MTGVSTGVSLLSSSGLKTLRDDVVGWWDFEGTLNSFNGTSPYTKTSTTGAVAPSQLNASVFKVGSQSFSCVCQDSSTNQNNFSLQPSLSPNKIRNCFTGWVRVLDGSDNSAPKPTINFSFPLMSNAFNVGTTFGVGVTGVSNTTSANIGFKGAVASSTINLNVWNFIAYWYDFTDSSQGVNGSEYFQVNNGTVYSKQLPFASQNFLYLHGLPFFLLGSYSGSGQNLFGIAIDSVNIYGRILTQQERSYIYNSGNGISYSQV